jgi:biopolymer transport protein ExbD
MPRQYRSFWLFALSTAFVGCDDPPKPVAEAPVEAAKPAPPAEPSKPSTPLLFIDEVGPRIGPESANLTEPGGHQKLASMVAEYKGKFPSEDVRLSVDRKAKPEWVAAYLSELGKNGFRKVAIRTQSRAEFPLEVVFTPEARASDAPKCTTVAMITEDRGTVVWKLSGGAAGKRPKGMAGPDLSMTSESIERVAKACKNSGALVVAGAKGVEWGLVYDLAASAKMIAGLRFDLVVVPGQIPVPGHKVELGQ